MSTKAQPNDNPDETDERARHFSDGAMTDVDRDDWNGSAHDDPDTIAEPAPERPWLLIALAAACIVAAIAGALGPWFRYERISEGSTHTWTTPGYQSSGFFIIIFATAALVALGVALLRDRAEPLAWVAFIGMALCTVIVIGVWTDPPQQTIPYGGAGTIGRLGWGPMVAGIAAPLGALFLFLTARRLTTREV